MNPTDLKLYELLGDKTLSFGKKAIFNGEIVTILCPAFGKTTDRQIDIYGESGYQQVPLYKLGTNGNICLSHEPTIADLHKWMDEQGVSFLQNPDRVSIAAYKNYGFRYNPSKSLLEQPEETKQAIIYFISSNS